VDTSKEKSNTNNNTSSLLQKLTYLNALSTVVEQEQSLLLTKLKEHHKECDHDNDFDNAYDLFWDDVTFAEQVLDPMTSPKKSDKSPRVIVVVLTENQRARGVHDPNVVDDEDELLLTDAIEKCQLYVDQTKLLDSLVWNLHMARATIRIGKLSMTSTITNSPDPNPTPETETTKDAAVDASDSSDVVAHNGLADIEYCIANTEAGASVSLVPNDSCDTRIHHHSAAQLHFLRAKALFALGTTNATAMEEAKTSLAKALVLDPSKRAEWTTELGGAAGIGPSEG
jgi:hypothetical protein